MACNHNHTSWVSVFCPYVSGFCFCCLNFCLISQNLAGLGGGFCDWPEKHRKIVLIGEMEHQEHVLLTFLSSSMMRYPCSPILRLETWWTGLQQSPGWWVLFRNVLLDCCPWHHSNFRAQSFVFQVPFQNFTSIPHFQFHSTQNPAFLLSVHCLLGAAARLGCVLG